RASPSAISSRSASDRYRPDTGPGPFAFTPPARANHPSHPPPPPEQTPPPPPAATPAKAPPPATAPPTAPNPRTPPAQPSAPADDHATPQRPPTSGNRCNDQLNPPPKTLPEAQILPDLGAGGK